jgi:hypothetical protein
MVTLILLRIDSFFLDGFGTRLGTATEGPGTLKKAFNVPWAFFEIFAVYYIIVARA